MYGIVIFCCLHVFYLLVCILCVFFFSLFYLFLLLFLFGQERGSLEIGF